ncbi:HipA domain-containing protein [Candidatus Poriferisodalis sp.]|uniref:HipA domain-containing protein n=1 Tax=Candidatus Poriferisodalis sp. TaxID=3101277 RepID=UPI003B58DBB5
MTSAVLRVRVGGVRAAMLARAADGPVLQYDADYLAFSEAVPLSLSLPLRAQPHEGPLVATWLDGLLPDLPAQRDQWRRAVGAVSSDPFDLLASPIGAECAGAVQFEPDGPTEPMSALEPVCDAELAEALRDMSEGALLGGWRDDPLASFSLAGTMPKLALRRSGSRWHEALGDEPTTHILKPSMKVYPGQAVAEHLALATARRLGITAARTQVAVIGGTETLIVERFDRAHLPSAPQSVTRIHQEDLCQALGRPAAQRFERDGGPSPTEVASLLRIHSASRQADLAAWFQRLMYCWVIVANDAHAKNHALLHLPGAVCRLAPLYDTASWLPYTDLPAADIHLAMSLGGRFEAGHGDRSEDWRHFARDIGVDARWAAEQIQRIAANTPACLQAEIDALSPDDRSSGITTRLLAAITQRCDSITA